MQKEESLAQQLKELDADYRSLHKDYVRACLENQSLNKQIKALKAVIASMQNANKKAVV